MRVSIATLPKDVALLRCTLITFCAVARLDARSRAASVIRGTHDIHLCGGIICICWYTDWLYTFTIQAAGVS